MRRGRIPPVAVLASFVDVTETGSVTRSAERLSLTQSAISHHVAQLEAFLGTPLFDRGERAFRPTAAALSLAARLRTQLDALGETLDAARGEASARRLRIAVRPDVLEFWLAARLPHFAAAHPELAIEVAPDYRRDVLSTGEADLQIRLGPPGEGQAGFALSQDEEVAVCSPGLAAMLPARQAFRAAPFLHERGASHTQLDWDRWLAELFGRADLGDGEPRENRVRDLASLGEVIEACRRGEGFALVRTLLVADDIAAGRLVVAVEERLPAQMSYGVIYPRHPAPGAAAKAFLGWLRTEAPDPRAVVAAA